MEKIEIKKNKQISKDGINRRDFIKKSAIVTGAALTSGMFLPGCTKKAGRDYIMIGRPNPTTGPLASFGEGTPWIDEKVLAEINKDGGIYIKEYGKKVPVKITVLDTESSPSKAGEVAQRLIVKEKVDMMLFYHTPDTVNPVASICEAKRVPAISLDSPLESWLEGGPYKWSFHAFWSVVDDVIPTYEGMWNQIPNNKKVGLLMANDADGVSWAKLFKEGLESKGYTVIDKGRFPYGHQDFTSYINAWKKEEVDIVVGNLIPPDFATAWKQCHQYGFVPKICTIGKAILFPAAVGAIGGDLPNGLTTEVWWSPYHPFKSSLTGETSKNLCEAYTKNTNKEWLQPLGFKMAGYEITADVLRRAQSIDKETLRKAVSDTDIDTIVGPIKYNAKNFARTPLVGGQWNKGKKFPWDIKIVYNQQHPYIPTNGKVFEIGA